MDTDNPGAALTADERAILNPPPVLNDLTVAEMASLLRLYPVVDAIGMIHRVVAASGGAWSTWLQAVHAQVLADARADGRVLTL